MEIISRKDAIAKGLTRYFTGKPCKYGNIAIRYTSNKMCRCEVCAGKHKQRVKNSREASNGEYEKKQKMYQTEYYQKNIHKRRASTKEWSIKNPERSKSLNKKKGAIRRQRTNNLIDSPELMSLCMHEAQIQCQEMSERFGGVFHIDHKIPLKAKEVSGLHCVANLQVLPAYMNYAKRNHLIYTNTFEWLKEFEDNNDDLDFIGHHLSTTHQQEALPQWITKH